MGGIVSYFTQSSDAYSRLTDIDKDAIARVGLPDGRFGILVCFLSDFESFKTIQVPTCHSKSSTSHRRMLSRYISPTNHEARLPRHVSVEVIPYFPVSSLLRNLSLENDVTLMSSGYMST